jgi:hypothetical protein
MNSSPVIVVYSAQVGGLDKPRKDILCFKKNIGFTQSRRAARMYKVLSHRFIDADYSIWCDGGVHLKKKPEDYLHLLNGKDIAVCRHPTNNSVFEEAADVINSKLDDKHTVESQMTYYKDMKYKPGKDFAMTGFIIRKHTQHLKDLNNAWWAEICAGSLRDQLSFNYIFDGHISYIDLPEYFDDVKNLSNEYYYFNKHQLSFIYKITSFFRFRTRLKAIKSLFLR